MLKTSKIFGLRGIFSKSVSSTSASAKSFVIKDHYEFDKKVRCMSDCT